MKVSIILIICLLKVPRSNNSSDMISCALGRVKEDQCPVDGGWSIWSQWGPCQGECGFAGRQIRTRNCSNPRPSSSDLDCIGNHLQIKQCYIPECTLDQYEKVLAGDLGRLQQLRKLQSLNTSQSALLTKCIASHCDFEFIEKTLKSANDTTMFWNALQCVKKNTGCPVAGGWGEWSAWTRCSARCGEGLQTKCRSCCNPPPSTSDLSCVGDSCLTQKCTGTDCKKGSEEGSWSEWSQWSSCNAPCNLGLTRRYRVCKNGQKQPNREKKPQVIDEDVMSDIDSYSDSEQYYNDNLYGNYGLDDNVDGYEDQYDHIGGYEDQYDHDENERLEKRSEDNCDNKIEYFSTEDEEDMTGSYPYESSVSPTRTGANGIKQQTQMFQTDHSTKHSTAETAYKHLESTVSLSTFLSTPEQNTKTTLSNGLKQETSALSTDYITDKTFSNNVIEATLLSKIPLTSATLENYSGIESSIPFQTPNGFQNTKSDTTLAQFILSNTERSHKSSALFLQDLSSSVKSETTSQSAESSPESSEVMASSSLKCNIHAKSSTKQAASAKKCKSKKRPVCTNINDATLVEDISETEKYIELGKAGKKDCLTIKAYMSTSSDYSKTERFTSSMENSKCHHTDTKKPHDITKSTDRITCLSTQREFETSENRETTEYLTTPSISFSETKSKVEQSMSSSYMSTTPSISFSETKSKVEQSMSSSYMSTIPRTEGSNNILTTRKSVSSTQSFSSASTPLNTDVENVRNVSVQSNICDLTNVLQLPSFNESFIVDDCKGPFEELKSCNTKPCTGEGGWSPWSAWSACSAECGIGVSKSTRSCTRPEPSNPAHKCPGEYTRQRHCFLQPCTVKVVTPRATFISGDSLMKYNALHQQSAVLMLYMRFRQVSKKGDLVIRRPACEDSQGSKCKRDLIKLFLYNGHLVLIIDVGGCRANIFSHQLLLVGDWHEVLLTVVGQEVTMRVDDSMLIQQGVLNCRPSMVDLDMNMELGGHFNGEVDTLRVNFRSYSLQKKEAKRDVLVNDISSPVVVSEVVQVKYEINSEDAPVLSLAQLLYAPCYSNDSVWKLELAIKPKLPDGMVLFFHGRDRTEFVFVTLEQTRVRLRVSHQSTVGECEQAMDVAPETWILITLDRPLYGTIGLAVNGNSRCVVSLGMAEPDTEHATLSCQGGVYLGEVPSSVEDILNVPGHSQPLHSPLGLLGSLCVDNQTVNLMRLVRKISPNLPQKHPESQYKFSSYIASSTVYYEEVQVMQGDPVSLLCMYNFNGIESNETARKPDQSLIPANWVKLDTHIEKAYENSSSLLKYTVNDDRKSTSLIISNYSDIAVVEGFYSCWLQYPLPYQPGLNIITYSVIIYPLHKGITFDFPLILFIIPIILLISFIVWLIFEAVIDIKNGSGLYRCGKLSLEEKYDKVYNYLNSDKGMRLLGDSEAVQAALERYKAYLESEMLMNEAALESYKAYQESEMSMNEELEASETQTAVTEITDSEYLSEEEKTEKNRQKNEKQNSLQVGKAQKGSFDSKREGKKPSLRKSNEPEYRVAFTYDNEDGPFSSNRRYSGSKISKNVLMEDLLTSDREENNGISGAPITANIGVRPIQNTPAYKNIQNELKFVPEKYKELSKYYNVNKNTG